MIYLHCLTTWISCRTCLCSPPYTSRANFVICTFIYCIASTYHHIIITYHFQLPFSRILGIYCTPLKDKSQISIKGQWIYFPLVKCLQNQSTLSRIRGCDPLDMVSMIHIEGHSRMEIEFSGQKIFTLYCN